MPKYVPCPGYNGVSCEFGNEIRAAEAKTCRMCLEKKREIEREANQKYCSGCNIPLGRRSTSGLCISCFNNQLSTSKLQRQERLASGQPTTEDRLTTENTKLRESVRSLQSLVDQYQTKADFEERLTDSVLGVLDSNPYRPQISPIPPPTRSELKKLADPHEMMLLLSDMHYPEVVDPAAAFGIQYNADIALRRLAKLFRTVRRYKDLRAPAFDIPKLTIASLGDMLSGDIHDELSVTNEMPMAEAITTLAYATFDLLLELLESFGEIEVVVVPGNHPRTTKKPTTKYKWNNWEYVWGGLLAGLARTQERLTVQTPKDLVYRHKIFNQTIGLTHGDGVKIQSFAGIPWYALDRRRNALQKLLRDLGLEQIDLLCYGHFHQLIYDDNVGLIINGTMKGADEFGIVTRYSAPPAVQGLLTFHPRHGITDLSRINLGDIR